MCLALGIDNPIAWLDSKDKDVLDGWEAYFRVEPWGLDWHQNAMVCQQVENLTEAIAASHGLPYQKTPYADYLPAGTLCDQKQKRKSQTPEQMLSMVQAAFRSKA